MPSFNRKVRGAKMRTKKTFGIIPVLTQEMKKENFEKLKQAR